jgi:hypothetical protein
MPPPQEFDPVLERLRAAQQVDRKGSSPSVLSDAADDILAPPYALSDVGARDEIRMRYTSLTAEVEQTIIDVDGDVRSHWLTNEEARASGIEGRRRSSSMIYRMLIRNLPLGTVSKSVMEFVQRGASIDITRFKIEKTREGRFNAIFENANDLEAAVVRLNGRRFETTTVECFKEFLPKRS